MSTTQNKTILSQQNPFQTIKESIYTHITLSVVDVSIAYEANLDQALEVIKYTASQVKVLNDSVVNEPDMLGVQALGASEIVIRIVTECKPNTQLSVSREMNASLKKYWKKIILKFHIQES